MHSLDIGFGHRLSLEKASTFTLLWLACLVIKYDDMVRVMVVLEAVMYKGWRY